MRTQQHERRVRPEKIFITNVMTVTSTEAHKGHYHVSLYFMTR